MSEKRSAKLSVDVEPELRDQVKIAAAKHGVSMREYVVTALRQALAIDVLVDDKQFRQSQSHSSDTSLLVTPKERQRGLKALAELQHLRSQLQQRYGRLKSESWELLEESRDERGQALSRTTS